MALCVAIWYAAAPKPAHAPVAAILASPSLRTEQAAGSPVASLQARIAANPGDLRARLALVSLYNRAGHPEQALQQIEEIIRIAPNNERAHLTLGNEYLLAKQYPKATDAYAEVCRRWPKDALAWQGLAAALFHQRRFREAAQTARRAVNLKPRDPNNHYVMAAALVEDATTYPDPQLQAPELNFAVKELTALTHVWPGVGDLYLRLGQAYMALHNRNGAVENMRRAAALFPDRADVALLLSKAYVSSGDRAAALQTVQSALMHHTNSPDLNDSLGQLLQAGGGPDADRQALAAFQNAVQLDPKNGRFLERLGTAYARINDLPHARQAFEAATQYEPDRAFPYQQLAAVYARQGDTKRSGEAAKTAEALAYNSDQLKHLQAMADANQRDPGLHLELADRYRYLGLVNPARDEYLAVLRLDPSNRQAQAGLGALARLSPSSQGHS